MRRRLRLCIIAMVAAPAACSRTPGTNNNGDAIAIISGNVAPSPTVRRMATLAAIPSPQPHPTVTAIRMTPRKDFVDPPLPPELRDDGGLIPLPPPNAGQVAAPR